MPWIKTKTMDQRIRLIGDWLSGQFTRPEPCKRHHISQAGRAEPMLAISACKVPDGSYRGSVRYIHEEPISDPLC